MVIALVHDTTIFERKRIPFPISNIGESLKQDFNHVGAFYSSQCWAKYFGKPGGFINLNNYLLRSNLDTPTHFVGV